MKNFARNTILREIHNPSSPDTNPSCSSSMKQQQREQLRSTPTRRQIYPDQNKPPTPSPDSAVVGKMKSPLPPRPPNPNKRKLLDAVAHENSVSGTDSGVQVVVRMRPPNKEEGEGETMVKQTSTDSLSVNGQMFTFDSVADTQTTQIEIFQLVGVPLVENCLAGFNSSVFAYGQTGSGKTYTIWGPANALSEEKLLSDQQGLTPRVFDRLFSRIKEEQIKHAEKQVKYQCRCSFLEIYNEQITDLLDPSQGSLQIREDVKSGVYVENLTEECVFTMKDVTRLLIKGLSNRKTGATSINSESSRSHSVFTCVVESRCKSTSDGVSSLRTSRINLVDLAGSERQKLTGAAGDRLKEAGNINRSLSQLGNLINILAEVSKTGKQRHIPYRDSRLTFLLQESLGGNGKLAMVCAISPSQSCKSETLSTLRFAQRAKAIKNKAIVNEVMQDDVNVLREVIRGLKDELLRMKANGVSTDPNGSYSTGWNARRSLNLLRFSLNHPMALPHVDYDGDTEMEIVEESGMEFSQLDSDTVASIEEIIGKAEANLIESEALNNKIPNDTDVVMQDGLTEAAKHENLTKDQDFSNANVGSHSHQLEGNVEEDHVKSTDGVTDGDLETPSKHEISTVGEISAVDASNYSPPGSIISASSLNLTIVPCDVSTIKSPIQSVSPKVSSSRKSLRTSEIITASRTDLKDEGDFVPDDLVAKSIKGSISSAIAMRASKNFNAPTEQLAASLHRGLEIMDCHRQSSALRRSAFRFSLKPVEYKPISVLDRVSVGVQTLPQDNDILEGDSAVVLCSNCKTGTLQVEEKVVEDNSNLQLVPIEGSESSDRLKNQVPKAVEKVLAGAIRREMALEEVCSKQTVEIKQLNRVVQQYKHERDCNAIIGQIRDDKIVRLERLMDGVLPTAEFMEEEFFSLTNEYKVLKEKYENHPEILRTKVELKRVQDELELYRSFHDLGERDVLLEEVQDLRSQLQYYTDSSSMSARKLNPPLQLTHSSEPSLTTPPLCSIPESNEETILEKFEQERHRWTEAESKWISLSEELRIELEASRSLADKQKQELDSEKKCAEELKEAMQMAMEGHARMLEQYADLQENHFSLLARHRKIQDGIDDVKKAAAKAGVKGAESRFINALAAEISALKVQREKETRHLRDENKELQTQLRDTAEAVQAAGELLVRLKEAEEAVAVAQDRAIMAEHEAACTFKQMNKLKRKYENEISDLNERFSESPLQKTTFRSAYGNSDVTKYDVDESPSVGDQQLAEPSWFSGYDRCNI